MLRGFAYRDVLPWDGILFSVRRFNRLNRFVSALTSTCNKQQQDLSGCFCRTFQSGLITDYEWQEWHWVWMTSFGQTWQRLGSAYRNWALKPHRNLQAVVIVN